MTAVDFSAVLPTANRRLFVEQAIRYWRRGRATLGSWAKTELVIVDSGSWALDRKLESDGVRIVRGAEKMKIGDALNLGICESSGKYVTILNDDDWYGAKWLLAAIVALEASAGELVGLSRHMRYDLFRRGAVGPSLEPFPAEGMISALGGTLSFTRGLWQKCPFRSESIGEDLFFLEDVFNRTGQRIDQIDGFDSFVYISHALNVTGRRPILPDKDCTAKARLNMGADVEWYDAISELCNDGHIELRRYDWHLPPPTPMAGMKMLGWRRG